MCIRDRELGYYNPLTKELNLDKEKAADWVAKGAQPTDTVRALLKKDGACLLYTSFGMMSDHPVQLTQYLPIAAALAVKNGLPAEEALKSITIYAARAAFVDDRVGSLEPGKDADIVLWDGNPLEIATRVKMVYLMGEKVRQY